MKTSGTIGFRIVRFSTLKGSLRSSLFTAAILSVAIASSQVSNICRTGYACFVHAVEPMEEIILSKERSSIM